MSALTVSILLTQMCFHLGCRGLKTIAAMKAAPAVKNISKDVFVSSLPCAVLTFRDRVSLSPWACDLPASASWKLGPQVHTLCLADNGCEHIFSFALWTFQSVSTMSNLRYFLLAVSVFQAKIISLFYVLKMPAMFSAKNFVIFVKCSMAVVNIYFLFCSLCFMLEVWRCEFSASCSCSSNMALLCHHGLLAF